MKIIRPPAPISIYKTKQTNERTSTMWISFYIDVAFALVHQLSCLKLHKTALRNYFCEKAVDVSCFPLIMAQSSQESTVFKSMSASRPKSFFSLPSTEQKKLPSTPFVTFLL